MKTIECDIFISYRRVDAEGWAGRLYGTLNSYLPDVEIFRDIDGIHAGHNFEGRILEAASSCKVLIALIGPKWLEIKGEDGAPRLDDPKDFIRTEINIALKRKIPIVPVLLGGAKVPLPEQLPEDIRPMSDWQAYELSDRHWDDDCQQLASVLGPIVKPSKLVKMKTVAILCFAAVLIAIISGVAAGYWMGALNVKGINGQAKPTGMISNEGRSLTDALVIRGRLIGLSTKWAFASNYPELYSRRDYREKNHADFSWLILSEQKLAPGALLTFYIDHGDSEHEQNKQYDISITEDFYKQEVVFKYDWKINKLTIKHGNEFIPLQERDALIAESIPSATRFSFNLIPIANAQVVENTKAISERLESNDPFIRIQARADLAAMGRDALPYVQEVLAKPSSSYRLQLGVLVALNNLKGSNASLTPEANCAIIRAANDPDATLKEQAGKYLSAHQHLRLNKCREHRPPYVPPFPKWLLRARKVLIVGESNFDDHEAANAVEDAINKWGKFQVVSSLDLADMILVIHCYPSEDILEARDAHSPVKWTMAARNGLAKNGTPLVGYLREAFEKAEGSQ